MTTMKKARIPSSTKDTGKKKKCVQKMDDWEKPIDWDEQFKWSRSVTFNGDQFNAWVQEVLPMTKSMKPATHTERDKHTHVGDYRFYMRPLPLVAMSNRSYFGIRMEPTRMSLPIYRGETEGYARFSTEVLIPIVADKSLTPWMSLTPNEILTQRGQVRRAKGNVGVAGLGMGWAVRRMLERKQVKHLTVVETCPTVAEVFGVPLQEEFGDKLSIWICDAYEVDWSEFDVSLWDIWQGYGDAAWDRKFHKIRDKLLAKGKYCYGWGQGVSKNY